LHIVLATFVFADVDRTAIMTAFAQATSFCSSAPISYVYVLCNSVSFEASLRLDRSKEWIRNVLSDNSACSSDNAGACLDVRTRYDSTVINHVVLSTSRKV